MLSLLMFFPVDVVPVDVVPVGVVPVDAIPVNFVPVDVVPVDTVPAENEHSLFGKVDLVGHPCALEVYKTHQFSRSLGDLGHSMTVVPEIENLMKETIHCSGGVVLELEKICRRVTAPWELGGGVEPWPGKGGL